MTSPASAGGGGGGAAPSSQVSTIAPSISVSTDTVPCAAAAVVHETPFNDSIDVSEPPGPGGPAGPAGPGGPAGPVSPFAPSFPGAPSLPGGPAGPWTFQLSACSDRLHAFPADGISRTPDLWRQALTTPSSTAAATSSAAVAPPTVSASSPTPSVTARSV